MAGDATTIGQRGRGFNPRSGLRSQFSPRTPIAGLGPSGCSPRVRMITGRRSWPVVTG